MNRALLAAVALTLLLLPLPTPAQTPTPTPDTTPDVVVEGLQVLGGPRWVHGAPDGNPEVRYVVTNKGTTDIPGYTVEYEWVKAGQTSWLRGSRDTSTDAWGPLGAGESREHVQAWNLRPEQQGQGAVRVTLTVGIDGASSRTVQAADALFVPSHDIALAAMGTDQQIRPGETRFVRIGVTNNGNSAETVLLDRSANAQPVDRPDVKEYLQFETLVVPPGETMTSTLFVDYEFSGDLRAFTINYTISAVTAYGRTLETWTPALASTSGNVPEHSPFLVERRGSGPLTVSGTGSLEEFLITNTGEDRDTYHVTAVPEIGWQAAADIPGSAAPADGGLRAALDPGQSLPFTLEVKGPDDAARGTPAQIGLEVASDRRPTQGETLELSFRMAGPAVRIEPARGWDEEIYTGDPARLGVVVHNDGDEASPEGMLLLQVFTSPDADADPVAVTTSRAPATLPGQTTKVELDAGEYTWSGPSRFRVDWIGPDTYAEALEEDRFLREAAAVLEPPVPLAGSPGESVGYRAGDHLLVLRNEGNAEETFRAQVTAGDAVLAGDPVFTLGPGQQRSVPLDHRIPLPSGNLTHVEATVAVSLADRPDIAWDLDISTAVEDAVPPVLELLDVPAVWGVGAPLALTVGVSDGSAVERVRADHTDPDGVATVYDLSEAGPGEWTTVLEPVSGNHTLVFTARDVHGNEAELSATVEVREIPAPEVELRGPAPGDEVTPATVIEILVDDALPLRSVRVEARDDKGVVWQRSVDVSGPLRFDLAGTPAGNVTILVEVVNAAGASTEAMLETTVQRPADAAVVDDDKDVPGPGLLFVALAVLVGAGSRRRSGRRDDQASAGPASRAPVAETKGRPVLPGAVALLVVGLLLGLPFVPAADTVDPVPLEWWGSTEIGAGFHIRFPVTVQNPHDHVMEGGLVLAEIDVAQKLIEAGWVSQARSTGDVLRSFDLDMASVRVVAMTNLDPKAAGTIDGQVRSIPELGGPEVPSIVFTGSLEDEEVAFDSRSDPYLTVMWKETAVLAPEEESHYVVYIDSLTNRIHPHTPRDYRNEPGGADLERTFWSGPGVDLVGLVVPTDRAGIATVIGLHDDTQVTVLTGDTESGTFHLQPAGESTLGNPFTIDRHEFKRVSISASETTPFRLQSSKPIVALVDSEGYVPATTGGTIGDEFLFATTYRPEQGQDSLFFYNHAPADARATTIELHSRQDDGGWTLDQTVRLSDTVNPFPYTIGARGEPPVAGCSWDPSDSMALVDAGPGEYRAVVTQGGPVSLQLQPVEGITQVPAVDGAPWGTTFWSALNRVSTDAGQCGDLRQYFVYGTTRSTTDLGLSNLHWCDGRPCPGGSYPASIGPLPDGAITRQTFQTGGGPERPIRLDTGAPGSFMVGRPLAGQTEMPSSLASAPLRGPLGGSDGGRAFAGYGSQGGSALMYAPFGATTVDTSIRYATSGAQFHEERISLVGGQLDDLPERPNDPIHSYQMDAGRPIVVLPRGVSTGFLAGVPATLEATVHKAEYRGHLVEIRPAKGGDQVTGSTVPGESITYEFTAWNRGNAAEGESLADTVDFSLSGVPSGWAASFSPPNIGPLESGASGTVRLTVTPPADAVVGTVESIQVHATSQENPKVTHSAGSVTHVKSTAGVGIWFDFVEGLKAKSDANPAGDPVDYKVFVRNTGSIADRIDLEFTPPKDGWEVLLLLDGEPVSHLDLGPRNTDSDTAELTLRVRSPADRDEDRLLTTVTARSASSPAVIDRIFAHTSIHSPSELSLEVEELVQWVEPGAEAVFNVTLRNEGGSTEVFFTTRADVLAGWTEPSTFLWQLHSDERPTVRSLSIGSGEEVRFGVSINASDDARTGDQVSTLLQVTAAGQSGTLAEFLHAIVRPMHRIDAEVPGLPLQVTEGGSAVEAQIEVTNNGNMDEFLLPAAASLPPDWTVTFAEEDLLVLRNSTATLGVEIVIPPGVAAGPYDVALALASLDGANTEVQLAVHVGTFASHHRDGPSTVLGQPGRTAWAEYAIRNDGNTPFDLHFEPVDEEVWALAEPEGITQVPPNANVTVRIGWQVPPTAANGPTIRLADVVMLPGSPEVEPLRDRIQISIDVGRPALRVVDAKAFEAPAGHIVRTLVANDGDRPAHQVVVALRADGQQVDSAMIAELPPGATRNVTLLQPALYPGPATVVLDPENKVVQADRKDSRLQVEAATDAHDAPGPGVLVALLSALLAGVGRRAGRGTAEKTHNGRKPPKDRRFLILRTLRGGGLQRTPAADTSRPGAGPPGGKRPARRPSRRWRPFVALSLAFVMVLPVLLAAVGPMIGAPRADATIGDEAAITPMHDLGRLLAHLPDPMSPETVLGPAAHRLLTRDAGGLRLADAPSGLAELVPGSSPGPGWEPLPVPDEPEGPEPLLAALGSHAESAGIRLPDEQVLRASIAALELAPETEQALSRLVLAYEAALGLEQAAVRDLSEDERRLIDGDPEAVAAWRAEDPDRTRADQDAMVTELVSRIDFSQRLRAADLLLRTIEHVRAPLALPPEPPGTADGAVVEAGETATDPAQTSVPAWPATGDPDMDRVFALVGLGARFDPASLPEVPDESLAEAMTGLAATLGLDTSDPLPLEHLETMPPSLGDAVAKIVTARRVGLESGDATAHTFLLLSATHEARPVLEAWAAVMDMDLALQQDVPQALDLVEAALSPAPTPSGLLAAGGGLPIPETVAPPPDLATLLQREGVSAEEAAVAVASLPAPVALGTAYALHGMQQFDVRREAVLAGLDPSARQTLEADTAAASLLLGAPSWNPEEAALVEGWARSMAGLGREDMDALRHAQVEALASVEAAVAVLGPYAAGVQAGEIPLGLPTREALQEELDEMLGVDEAEAPSKPWYRRVLSGIANFRIVGTASAQVPSQLQPDCPPLPGDALNDCKRDIWFRSTTGRTVLITGFGTTEIGPANVASNPDLAIDLGGNDRYRHPVGAAEGFASIRVAIDLGGRDEYHSLPSRLAHGAALGTGSLGLLWDLGGRDEYLHDCSGQDCGAQGYGANGGVGILFDGDGQDTYDARDAWAHGVGANGGVGILFDQGAGSDSLRAGRGQGYATGDRSLGLLLNDGEGANQYRTSAGNSRYQGGHESSVGGAGILIDMGGQGTTYSNLGIPDGAVYQSFDPQSRIRQDDALWVDRSTGGFGIGLDSTLENEDEDEFGFPNLVELLAGSDPQDPESSPGIGTVGTLVELVESLVGDGVDPDDPLGFLPETIWRDDLLCGSGAGSPGNCTALLHIGGTTDNTITEPAHILIELGGDNTYATEVAGPGDFWGPTPVVTTPPPPIGPGHVTGTDVNTVTIRYPGVGSFALDLSGDDTYMTPNDKRPTQGAVRVSGDILDTSQATAPPTRYLASASLLLDLDGDDSYNATDASQGAADAGGDCLGMNNPGEAWLVDLGGDDTYNSESRSQGYVLHLAGRAGLIDLRGDDEYSFERQAAVDLGQIPGGNIRVCGSLRDVQPLALFFDGMGRDLYVSSLPVGTSDEEFFLTQGTGPLPGNRPALVPSLVPLRTEHGRGVFIDERGDEDTYLIPSALDEGYVDISDRKNDRFRSPNDPDGAEISDRRVFFSDGATRAVPDPLVDSDGDGAPDSLEGLFGTDPEDPADHLGTIWESDVDGLDDGDAWLRIPGQIAIAGRGDSVFDESYPFLVSLGGSNVYTAPGTGGNALTGGVTLLLDAGGGDTTYQPAGGCASLGGATSGVAVMADLGGSNGFLMEASDEGCGRVATQGASTGAAVGILATLDSVDRFQAESMDGVGLLAQGASAGGLGLLASLGGPGSTFFAPSGTAQGYGERDGQGILLSGTGDDRFEAGPWSQGAGNIGPGFAGTGLLYDGGGNDEYIIVAPQGPAFSQGAAQGGRGLLIDLAGDDRYDAPDSTHVQGAGHHGGVGLLLDGGGHDTYRALAGAQGHASGMGAMGLLIDLLGRDTYRLADPAAGGLGTGRAGPCGIFAGGPQVDPDGAPDPDPGGAPGADPEDPDPFIEHWPKEAGNWTGQAMEWAGQTGGSVEDCDLSAETACGLFLDGAGDDRYPVGVNATNDRTWQDPHGCGVGIDTDRVDDAMDALRGIPLPVGLRDVELEVRSAGEALNGDEVVAGDVLLRAYVDIVPAQPEHIDRVAFLANNEVIGHGTLQDEEETPLTYEFLWSTRASQFPELHPDGNYTVRASVYRTAGQGPGSVDLPAMDSQPLDLYVDNPPLVEVALSSTRVSDPLGPAELAVTIGQDRDWPDGVDPDALCDAMPPEDMPWDGCRAGAYLDIQGTSPDGTPTMVADAYVPAGTHRFLLPAPDDAGSWVEGDHVLSIDVLDLKGDSEGDPDHRASIGPLDLLVDRTPPVSQVLTPQLAGIAHQGEAGALRVTWGHSDDSGADQVAGVEKVCLFRLRSSSEPLEPDENWCFGPGEDSWDVAVETDELHFVVAAIDAAQNPESPCKEGEVPPEGIPLCFLAKAGEGVRSITVDFDAPTVNGVRALDDDGDELDAFNAYLPGTPIRFTAVVADVGTGLDRVEVLLPGGFVGEMEPDPDVQDGWFYDAWHEHNQDLEFEGILDYTVVARDLAGNAATDKGALLIDSVAPRVLPLSVPTRFLENPEHRDAAKPAGEPEDHVLVRTRVEDAHVGQPSHVGTVLLDATSIGAGDAIECDAPDPLPHWECTFQIPEDTEEGDYPVRFTATDTLGNVNDSVEVVVQVRTLPPEMKNISVTSLGHDHFQVEWETTYEGTTEVQYGLTADTISSAGPGSGLRQQHSVEVAGLAPSSEYHYRVVSANIFGAVNATDPPFTITTLNAYDFRVADFPPGQIVAGELDVAYELQSFVAGNQPVQATLMVQDAARTASPFDVDDFEVLPLAGAESRTVDLSRFPDGEYRLIFDLDREGDSMRVESPLFRVDNTDPVVVPLTPRAGSAVADARPEFEAVLLDPMGLVAPAADTLSVFLNGTQVPHTVLGHEVTGPSSLQRRITFTLDQDLADGLHGLELMAADPAGNVGRADWPLRVDLAPPTLQAEAEATPLPGPDLAKPRGQVHVVAHLDDATGVAGVHIDRSPIGGTSVPLLHMGSGRWEATIGVPADAPSGAHDLPLIARDVLDNEGVAGHVNVTVDADAPRFTRTSVEDVGHTWIELAWSTDEPTQGWTGGGPLPEAAEWRTEHAHRMTGLDPGRQHRVTLHASDHAGNTAVARLEVATLADAQPPTGVRNLTASTPGEGVVALAWGPAADNAGIQAYRVYRETVARAPAMQVDLAGDVTSFLDDEAPAGRTVRYTVTPVDVAGLEGPVQAVPVDVVAKPRLSDAEVTPKRGFSDDPFTFQVEYQHAGDRPADSIYVTVAGKDHPLTRMAGSGACHDGCLYRAQVRLPASSIFGADDGARFYVVTSGQSDSLTVTDLPFVMRGGGVFDLTDGTKEAPAPGFAWLLLTLAFCVLVFRRLRT